MVFWSELDRDASGGISYDEFRGKLHFNDGTEYEVGSDLDLHPSSGRTRARVSTLHSGPSRGTYQARGSEHRKSRGSISNINLSGLEQSRQSDRTQSRGSLMSE